MSRPMKVTGPSDLIAAIPHVMGFGPTRVGPGGPVLERFGRRDRLGGQGHGIAGADQVDLTTLA